MSEQAEIEQPAQPSALTLAVQKVSSELAGFDKIAAGLEELHKEHPVDVVLDVTAAEGMKQAIKSRAAWRDPRIAIEKVRKAAKAPVLQLGKDIDSFAAELTEKLQAGELHYDGMIQAELTRKAELKKQEEEREAKRIAAIQGKIAYLFTDAEMECFGKPAEVIARHLANVTAYAVAEQEFAEFTEAAKTAQEAAAAKLRTMLAAQQEREAEAERQRQQAEENARQAAELARQRAEFEAQQKKAREEQEAREAADRAARDKVEREQREERERIAAEQKKLDDAKRAAEEAKAAEERRKADEAAAAERKRLDEEAAERRRRTADIQAIIGWYGDYAETLATVEQGLQKVDAWTASPLMWGDQIDDAKAAIAATRAALIQRREHLQEKQRREEEEAKAEAKRQRAQRKLAAAQKAGPRLLAAGKVVVAIIDSHGGFAQQAEAWAAAEAELRAAIAEGDAA